MSNESRVEALRSQIGKEIHVSDWISVSQDEINDFGKVTRDLDPTHIDPEFARANGPFGTPVLFGFQILSMLSHLCQPLRFEHGTGAVGYELNYGLNRVRFIAPIPVDALFRNHVVLKKIEQRKNGDYLLTTINTIELQEGARPALVAEWIGLVSGQAPSVGDATRGKGPSTTGNDSQKPRRDSPVRE
jgi:acyl dehydratase